MRGEESSRDAVPEAGTRVEHTGIALVHAGEYITPAPGSAAVLSERAPEPVTTYNFPVHVEVVGELDQGELRRVAQYVFDELDATLRRTR